MEQVWRWMATRSWSGRRPPSFESLDRLAELILEDLGRVPIVIVDDSDRWLRIENGPDRSAAVEPFFRETCRMLAERNWAVVVAVHPDYLGAPGFQEARQQGYLKGVLRSLFAQGIVVNVLNPKTALFFFAFSPQFVDVSEGAVGLQIAVLGDLFIVIAVVSDGMYALAAGTAAHWLRGSAGFIGAERWVSGSVLVGLGVTTAVSGSHRGE